jgi:hypothetical protein
MYLVHPTPSHYLYLDTQFLFDGKKPDDYEAWERCLLISVKARTGYDLEFQVLTEKGMLRDKLPISALRTGINDSVSHQEDLQRWSCPSYYLTIVQLPMQTGKAWIDGDQRIFKYWFTVDFASGMEIDPGSDVDIPEEHKAMHIIELLDSSELAAMPNNSVVWDHATLVSRDNQLRSNPGYIVQKEDYSVERFRCAKSAVVKDLSLYDISRDDAY